MAHKDKESQANLKRIKPYDVGGNKGLAVYDDGNKRELRPVCLAMMTMAKKPGDANMIVFQVFRENAASEEMMKCLEKDNLEKIKAFPWHTFEATPLF